MIQQPCRANYALCRFVLNSFLSVTIVVALIATSAGVQASQHKLVMTWCTSSEKVIFSCPLNNGKTVSVCASLDLSKEAGSLQYRFGRLGATPELKYPMPSGHPSTNFNYYPGEPFGAPEKKMFYGPSRILSFVVGKYRYSLEVYKNRGTGEFYGDIRVTERTEEIEKYQKPLANLSCSMDRAIDNIQDLDELEIPRQR